MTPMNASPIDEKELAKLAELEKEAQMIKAATSLLQKDVEQAKLDEAHEDVARS